MSANEELAVRNTKRLQEENRDYNDYAHKIIDTDCVAESGKFVMQLLPGTLPALFTIRFTAPADYVTGDVIVVRGKELPVRTPGMTAATSDIFRAGAVIQCDIDMERELAFFWQSSGGGTGVQPNLSYDEQFAGYYDEAGKKVYMKSVDMGALSGTTGNCPHNIENFERLIDLTVVWYNETKQKVNTICWWNNQTGFFLQNGGVQFNSRESLAGYSAIARLVYTCTDR